MSSSESDSDEGFSIKRNLTKSLSKKLLKFKSNYKVANNDSQDDSEIEEIPIGIKKKPTIKEQDVLSSDDHAHDDLPIALRKKGRGRAAKIIKPIKDPPVIIKKPIPIPEMFTKQNNKLKLDDRLTALQAECSTFIQDMNTMNKSNRGKKRTKKQPKNKKSINNKSNILNINQETCVVLSDDEPEEINPIVTVHFLWKSIEKKEFKVKKFDKLDSIYDYFINEHSVNPKLLLFTINDKEINLNKNTYASLCLSDDVIVEGGILPDSYLDKAPHAIIKQFKGGGIRFKVQYDSHRNKHFDVFLKINDKMDKAYSQVVQEIGLNVDKFRLTFDGSIVKHSDSLADLDMEEGDILDVKLL